MYDMMIAKICKQLIDKFSHILTRCNVLLMNDPHDEELLDLQVQLQDIVEYLYCQSYQKASVCTSVT